MRQFAFLDRYFKVVIKTLTNLLYVSICLPNKHFHTFSDTYTMIYNPHKQRHIDTHMLKYRYFFGGIAGWLWSWRSDGVTLRCPYEAKCIRISNTTTCCQILAICNWIDKIWTPIYTHRHKQTFIYIHSFAHIWCFLFILNVSKNNNQFYMAALRIWNEEP